ncbi:Protein-L-isoaspartate O-methyltransferase [hydrothermal vent metagenome]|uniref:protein-L-isoaspartate(D-aspartate) O-methyltransferase n=1 Tax=hydrothermal vent metagenome TaxID=652676 RepID=A0A1W1BDW1_9ZZZZ
MNSSPKLQKMVNDIDMQFPLDPCVYDALLSVERDIFVPIGFAPVAYKLDALPISASQWISSPLTVAKMTQYLKLEGADSVLEIGCGSGYQAVVLSRLCRRVFTIERIEILLREAKTRFSDLKINHIFTRFDDGQRGWKSFGPFDRILFSATADEISPSIFEQLAEGGILVAPIQVGSKEIITRFTKKRGKIFKENLEFCHFVPILDGTI